jgi:hypothetical protein
MAEMKIGNKGTPEEKWKRLYETLRIDGYRAPEKIAEQRGMAGRSSSTFRNTDQQHEEPGSARIGSRAATKS